MYLTCSYSTLYSSLVISAHRCHECDFGTRSFLRPGGTHATRGSGFWCPMFFFWRVTVVLLQSQASPELNGSAFSLAEFHTSFLLLTPS